MLTSSERPFTATGAAVTNRGGREDNEDSVLADESCGLFAVADGMGGLERGLHASRTAINSVRGTLCTTVEKGIGGSAEQVRHAIDRANEDVVHEAGEAVGELNTGTTLSIIWLCGTTAICAHVGDSRAYLLREQRLQQLTRDHSVVQELIDRGELRPENRTHHPRRNVITRALGIEWTVECDVAEHTVIAGDRFLLCSDGLTGALTEAEIYITLSEGIAPVALAERLVKQAVDAYADDNVSAVVVDITSTNSEQE